MWGCLLFKLLIFNFVSVCVCVCVDGWGVRPCMHMNGEVLEYLYVIFCGHTGGTEVISTIFHLSYPLLFNNNGFI